jgi:homoserine O-acetyltransferase/O-succinyltransferase
MDLIDNTPAQGSYHSPMAEPASTLAAGSVGTVETLYIDLPEPVRLECGRELYPVRVAYETYGTLSPRRDNVILVCHALSGDAHAAGFAKAPAGESTRDGFGATRSQGDGQSGHWMIRSCPEFKFLFADALP